MSGSSNLNQLHTIPHLRRGVQDIAKEELHRPYDDALAMAIQDEGYYGLNSIIAYRTRLDISPLSLTADQGLQTLEDLADGGMLSQDEAQETAGPILAQNARGLYGLDD